MIKFIHHSHHEYELVKKYGNSPEKILVLDWERWMNSDTNWWKNSEEDNYIPIDELIVEIKKHDICFFLSCELIDMTSDKIQPDRKKVLQNFMTELNKLNVFYITMSEDTHYPFEESRTFNIPWFADKQIYKSQDTTIDFDYRQKDFTFNMLLGSEREHRTQMFERFRWQSYVYSTYMGHHYHRNNSDSNKINNLEDNDIHYNLYNQDLSRQNGYRRKLNTMIEVKREDQDYCISHITPESIYNNSHFDIVAESQPLRDSLNFTTEKTGKPLSTGRFFIWYNSPHKVEYLRKFGFELQDYLCEYDNIIDNDKRLEAIFELIKEIGDNENYIKKIYTDTKDARIHNQEVYTQMRSTNRYDLDTWISNQVEKL
jgi:hypothetical protein|tara:strand:- start:60 stop:1172 length:1113 start_codon:yes stop_codon:yes gene_type:complete